MGMTTLLRLSAGLLTFAVIARVLGPHDFGVFALWMSFAVLSTVLSNYGLVPYVLKQVGSDPAASPIILTEALTGKLFLASVVAVVLLGVSATVVAIPAWVFIPLFLAALADCFSEFFGACLRAHGKFAVESRIVGIGALAHSAVIIAVVLVSRSLIWTACGYLVVRLFIAAVMFNAVSRHVSKPSLSSIRAALSRLRASFAYALDYGVQSMFGQVDSIVLNHYLGPIAVGSYQAGMRFFQTCAQAVGVFSNVFLPRISAQSGVAGRAESEGRRVQAVFLTAGAVLGGAMAFFADTAVRLLLGSAYSSVISLMPLFGLLFFLRFSAAAWGILLTAAGHQSYRTVCGVFYWVLIFALAAWFVPIDGSRGWLIALCGATIWLIIAYAWRGRSLVGQAWFGIALPMLVGIPMLVLAITH